MINKLELDQILHFVSKRWLDMSNDPKNLITNKLPSKFWMNSVGGKAGKGRWVTMLMYTEDIQEAESFKEVLLRWQKRGIDNEDNNKDLIQINKSKNI